MLREELKQSSRLSATATGKKRKYFPKEILSRILTLFPNLISDPVYSMAFRNCHVDRSIVDFVSPKKKKKKGNVNVNETVHVNPVKDNVVGSAADK